MREGERRENRREEEGREQVKGWRGEERGEKEKMKKEGGKATMRKLLARMRIMRDREWENTDFDEAVTAKEDTLFSLVSYM